HHRDTEDTESLCVLCASVVNDSRVGDPVTLRPSFVVFTFFIALSASAQFFPPVPKGVNGRGLHRTIDIPLPQPKTQWVRAISPHFITVSAAGERRTREVIDDLETV